MRVEEVILAQIEIWALEAFYYKCQATPNDNNRRLQIKVLEKIDKINSMLFEEGHIIW